MYYQLENSNIRLLGSVHIIPQKWKGSPPPTKIIDAFSWAQDIWTETDFSKPLSPYVNLQTEVNNDKLWKKIKSLLLQEGISMEEIQAARPHELSWLLTKKFLTHTVGVEDWFANQPNSIIKVPHYLETIQERLDIYNRLLTMDDYVHALKLSVDEKHEAQKKFEEGYEEWLKNDAIALGNTIQIQKIKTPKYYDALIDQRNKLWAPRINNMSPLRNTLIIVGCFHLCGTGDSDLRNLLTTKSKLIQL